VAEIGDEANVLEVGTGTGYSTALMCHRLGADHVTFVEYDRCVADRAAAALHEVGCTPTLVVGDGLRGHQPQAPYDAPVATCAVRSIPFSWMVQARDGGSITNESAITVWQAEGAPDQPAFGMTVTPDHLQRVWLSDPTGPSWDLPV
jgi:protein-L-isoaspartate O-methyltransferase